MEAGNGQAMSAAKAIRCAENNPEKDETQIYQIWIPPTSTGLDPASGIRPFPKISRAGRCGPLASGFEGDGDAQQI